MKAKLEFDLSDPIEEKEFRDAINGTKYKLALEEIWTECFRPLFKHGYNDSKIDEGYPIVQEAIERLSEKYNEVIENLRDDIS